MKALTGANTSKTEMIESNNILPGHTDLFTKLKPLIFSRHAKAPYDFQDDLNAGKHLFRSLPLKSTSNHHQNNVHTT